MGKILESLNSNWQVIDKTAEEMASEYGMGDHARVVKFFELANSPGDRITGCPTNRVFPAQPGLILQYLRSVPQHMLIDYPGLFEEEKEFLGKVGPQGGIIPGAVIHSHYKQYLGQRVITQIPRSLIRARNILMKVLGKVAVNEDYYTVNARSAGCSFGGHKNEIQSVMASLDCRFDRPSQLQPNRVAGRYQRGKVRILGNDDIMNLYKVDYILHAVKNYMRFTFPWFSTWLNPYSVQRGLIQKQLAKKRLFIEFDVTMMDRGLDIGVVRELIMPLYETMLAKQHFETVQWYTELAFQQPAYVDGKLYTGWHAGASGQMIISDYETWLVLLINFAAVLEAESTHELLLVCGDDQLLSGNWTLAEAQRIQNIASSLATQVGLIMPLEKSRISSAPMVLRHFWFPNHTMLGDHAEGIYPATMAWNNIMYPEELPASPSQAVVSTLSKADAFANHPLGSKLLSLFWESIQLPKHFNDAMVDTPGRSKHSSDAMYSLKDVKWIKMGVEAGYPAAIRTVERVGKF